MGSIYLIAHIFPFPLIVSGKLFLRLSTGSESSRGMNWPRITLTQIVPTPRVLGQYAQSTLSRRAREKTAPWAGGLVTAWHLVRESYASDLQCSGVPGQFPPTLKGLPGLFNQQCMYRLYLKDQANENNVYLRKKAQEVGE